MEFCTICTLNGKKGSQYELMLYSPYKKKKCAWCHCSLERNLKATFNMKAIIQPNRDDGIVIFPNFGPICDPCLANQSTRSDGFSETRHYSNMAVNSQIICTRCFDVLSYKIPQSPTELRGARLFDSTSSIDDGSTFMQKLVACCCFKCG